ncbi:MAG: DUF4465 domain-containing protein [Thermogutta sp.]|nr:DUF4465 domain-containing protein [Thermogutta sp.]
MSSIGWRRRLAVALGIAFTAILGGVRTSPAGTVDLEDLSLSPNSYWNGSPNNGNNTFTSGGFTFYNTFDNSWGVDVWSGFAYSNMTDTATPGYTNQYSAAAGSGAGGSANYAVGFVDAWGSPPRIAVPAGVSLVSADITNTTYPYLSMRDGDSFAKKFGGTSGDDPDWFKLTILGKDLAGNLIAPVEFYLADFRFSDNAQDYILNTWATVDLSPIASAGILEFALDSSDVGQWGMNTPAYFALDNIVFQTAGGGGQVVPEPGSAVLLLGGIFAGGYLYRKRRRKTVAA